MTPLEGQQLLPPPARSGRAPTSGRRRARRRAERGAGAGAARRSRCRRAGRPRRVSDVGRSVSGEALPGTMQKSVRYNEGHALYLALLARKEGTKRGYLSKRTAEANRWHEKWFALYQNVLFYFESEQSARPAGIYMLEGCSCERTPAPKGAAAGSAKDAALDKQVPAAGWGRAGRCVTAREGRAERLASSPLTCRLTSDAFSSSKSAGAAPARPAEPNRCRTGCRAAGPQRALPAGRPQPCPARLAAVSAARSPRCPERCPLGTRAVRFGGLR